MNFLPIIKAIKNITPNSRINIPILLVNQIAIIHGFYLSVWVEHFVLKHSHKRS
jgi:hypothetical protein